MGHGMMPNVPIGVPPPAMQGLLMPPTGQMMHQQMIGGVPQPVNSPFSAGRKYFCGYTEQFSANPDSLRFHRSTPSHNKAISSCLYPPTNSSLVFIHIYRTLFCVLKVVVKLLALLFHICGDRVLFLVQRPAVLTEFVFISFGPSRQILW